MIFYRRGQDLSSAKIKKYKIFKNLKKGVDFLKML